MEWLVLSEWGRDSLAAVFDDNGDGVVSKIHREQSIEQSRLNLNKRSNQPSNKESERERERESERESERERIKLNDFVRVVSLFVWLTNLHSTCLSLFNQRLFFHSISPVQFNSLSWAILS